MSNLEWHDELKYLDKIEKECHTLKKHIAPIRPLFISKSESDEKLFYYFKEIKELYELMKSKEPSSEKYKKYERQLKSFLTSCAKQLNVKYCFTYPSRFVRTSFS